MCRYTFKKYKHHFVCFQCRKTFKQRLSEDYWKDQGLGKNYEQYLVNPKTSFKTVPLSKKVQKMLAVEQERIFLCPQCRSPMADVGLDFKAPPKTNIKAWKILKELYKAGKKFYSCGCYGPGYIPRNTHELRKELEEILNDYTAQLKKAEKSHDQKAMDEKTYWQKRYEILQKYLKSLDMN